VPSVAIDGTFEPGVLGGRSIWPLSADSITLLFLGGSRSVVTVVRLVWVSAKATKGSIAPEAWAALMSPLEVESLRSRCPDAPFPRGSVSLSFTSVGSIGSMGVGSPQPVTFRPEPCPAICLSAGCLPDSSPEGCLVTLPILDPFGSTGAWMIWRSSICFSNPRR
jgi:hypothetical protein